jgi:hypothetical protein
MRLHSIGLSWAQSKYLVLNAFDVLPVIHLLGDYSNAIGMGWAKITGRNYGINSILASEVYKSCPAMKAMISRVNAPIDTTRSIMLKSKLTDSICLCISKTDTSAVNNLNDAELMLTRCILKNVELMTEYTESIGIDLSKGSNEKTQDLASSLAAKFIENVRP